MCALFLFSFLTLHWPTGRVPSFIADFLRREGMVNVDVEYCGYCDFESQCKEMAEIIKKMSPQTDVLCHRGRKGSFEVKIDDVLVHSMLQTMALPDYKSVADNVQRAVKGEPLTKVKEQKIRDCVVM